MEGQESWEIIKADVEKVCQGRRSSSARDDRQARPGMATTAAPKWWPRPLPTSVSTSTSAHRSRRRKKLPACCRERRACHRRFVAGGRPQDAAAGTDEGAWLIRCRRHHRFAGGVIPAQDYDHLFNAGAKAIFGPGTRIE